MPDPELMKKHALITGASQGLGRAVAMLLARRGYALTINARREEKLVETARELSRFTVVERVPGDVSEIAEQLAERAQYRFGPVDLLINNASELGPSPMPRLEDYPWDALLQVFKVNVVAPVHLTQLVLPRMKERGRGTIVNITSDAGVNAYPGWGGYGASKAALDLLTAVLAVEHPELRVYAVDPGDMATEMHQAAFPGEDISDRPAPATVVPALLTLVDGELPSGRYRAADLPVATGAAR
jgi:NAD(P)-dependent dehydrogenase (short-subunit alcohol dehydrogenase family)